jgi:DNA-binding winged helix-turn-helix (wHTH) protein
MKGATRISLEHKPREVLAHLLKNPQKLIRYRELKTAVWGNTHVEDSSVHNAVSKVNVALKRAQPGAADFIRTVPGVGVEILVDVDPAPAMEDRVDGATEAKRTEVGSGQAPRIPPDNLGGAKSSSESGLDLGRIIPLAAESGASGIADRLCAEIQKIVAAYDDRGRAVRFIKLHLEGEAEDTAECMGKIAALPFSNGFYVTEIAEAKTKKRALDMMLRELHSMASGPMNSQEIAEELAHVARFYLK